ncbi:hypothetical protein [Curtobacterium sp. MCBA15_012]|uniref:hypothetical protein n=1 Tax=Curtobacterium sp. MCBA15_012 TaxID=1898738 RepID=UPI0009112BC9|nr:hypothetical protein [Curtobacterium sp. MCBA15_012]WIA99751.1 hypothetical protein QOL15_14750 [Curtobacterium sp. MCBA15_012]
MRTCSVGLPDVLAGSFDRRWLLDVFYDGVRVLQDVPCTRPDFTDDAGQLVQSTGTTTIVYQGDFAESIAPTEVSDLLAPFGTQVEVYLIVSAGPGFTERIRMGRYMVAETPSVVTTRFVLNGGVVSKGDRIDLTLKDLFYGVQVDRFDTPGSPPSLDSAWAEVQRLTGLQVTKSVADAPIPTTVAYQEDRLQGVYDVANYALDAVACLTPDGTVSMRPNVWPDPVDTVRWGDDGTLVHVNRGLANDSVYNKVVVRAYDSTQGAGVLASGEITDGPLRTRNRDGSLSPYRRRPTFYSSQFITTQAQAEEYVAKWLPRVSQLKSVQVTITEVLNPLRELGDVLTVDRLGEQFIGRVVGIRRGTGANQQTTLEVGAP